MMDWLRAFEYWQSYGSGVYLQEPSVPSLAPDDSLFSCRVDAPAPDQVQGSVHAFRSGTTHEVGRLTFAYREGEPPSLQTIRYLVHPDCLRRGCARELTKALKRNYPGVLLSTSPATPTRLGRATMLQLHGEGYIDSLASDLESLNLDELEDEDNSEIWASITKVDCRLQRRVTNGVRLP
jgi:hypothetical protein